MKTYSSKPESSESQRIVPCPLCGADFFRRKWNCSNYSFVRCQHCGVTYQNPQTITAHIHSRYDEDYFSYEISNESSFLNLMKLGLNDVNFSDWESELKHRGKALDIGCATGALIDWLRTRNWSVEGLEICKPSAEYGRRERGLTIHGSSLEESGLTEETYSFIHSSHVIEHLNDPVFMVKEVYRLLVPEGHFVCVTPNTSSFQARLYNKNWRSAIADHLVLFSAKRLKQLLRDEGFTIISWKTWGGIAAGTVSPQLKRIVDNMAKSFYWGDVVIVLAKKGK